MNKREFYVAVIEANVNEEITGYAQTALEAMDAANEKSRAKAAEKRAEKAAEMAPIVEAIMAAIAAEPKTATTLIAEAEVEVTPQAVAHMLKPYVESGTIEKANVKVEGKKGTQVGYKRA